jgi:hypothetical protein
MTIYNKKEVYMYVRNLCLLGFLVINTFTYTSPWRFIWMTSVSTIPGAVVGGVVGVTTLRPFLGSVAESVIIPAIVGAGANMVTALCICLWQGCCCTREEE